MLESKLPKNYINSYCMLKAIRTNGYSSPLGCKLNNEWVCDFECKDCEMAQGDYTMYHTIYGRYYTNCTFVINFINQISMVKKVI